MGEPKEPQNRLDNALWRLEQTLDARTKRGLRRVQEAIALRRQKGGFDEWPIIQEIMRIESHAYITERELDLLAERVAITGPLTPLNP